MKKLGDAWKQASPIVLTIGIKIMNQERGISFRRHQYSRLKAKRINLHYWGKNTSDWSNVLLGIMVNTPKISSSTQCRMNPRKIEGCSIKEKSHLECFSNEYKAK